MIGSWRPLVLAAALNVVLGVGVGTAQTVMVRNATPGSTIELVLNAAMIGSATASPAGEATLAVDLAAHGGKEETDAYIHIDVCGNLYRVLFAERGQLAPPQAESCSKRESLGLFLVRQLTSFLVDMSGPSPSVRLRQGPLPVEWFASEEEGARRASTPKLSPKGAVLFGGGGLGKFSDVVALACGNVAGCEGDAMRLDITAGAAFWVTRFLAVEAAFLKPSDITARGGETGYRFASSLDTEVTTFVAKAAIPIGRTRIYAQGGANYHWGVSNTTQTIDDTTVTIDEIPVTITGGTQELQLRTAGWGWLFGAGFEVWVTPAFAIYAEGSRMQLKGDARDGSEGGIDDRLTTILVGARFHIGR